MVRSILLCLLLVLCAGCRNDAFDVNSPGEPNLLVMKVYPLPAGGADDIRKAIAELLIQQSKTNETSGGARLVGDSSLVVLAPATLQPSVERTIEALGLASKAAGNLAAAEPTRKLYSVQFWIVQEADSKVGESSLPVSIEASEAAIRSQFGVGPLSVENAISLSLSHFANARDQTGMEAIVELRAGSLQHGTEIILKVRNDVFNVEAQIPLQLDRPTVLAQVGGKPGGEGALRPRFVIVLVRDAAAAG